MGFASPATGEEPFDVIITGGKIVDGSGAPWYLGDVGLRDGRIAAIGRLAGKPAERTIDASGLIVAPGFIDMMGQTATPMLDSPEAAVNLLAQGITTINAGEGVSAAPVFGGEASRSRWRGMAEYFLILEQGGLPLNVAQTVGHTQVRLKVLGDVDRAPTPEELEEMKKLVREAMEAGAIGLSTALIYPPAIYATTDEITELASVAGEHGGGYFTHMRNEGDSLLEAIDEALVIGRRAKTPVHIFHLKAAGKNNWPKMQEAIASIAAARAAGEQVAADIYPYVNNGLWMPALVHPRHFEKGFSAFQEKLGEAELRETIRREMEGDEPWENWFRHVGGDWSKIIVGEPRDDRYANLAGKSVAELAAARGQDVWETFFNLVAADAFVLPQSMSEANVIRAMQQPFVSFCTDVGPAGGSGIASHPRAYGAFPRIFARYVRELGALSLERAISQASAVAANEIRAYDRGRIAVGLAADIAVFDFERFTDKATIEAPASAAEGMKYVFVNGRCVFEEGRFTGARPGKVLRGPGFRRDLAPAAILTGPATPEMKSIDDLAAEVLDDHGAPGAAVAIASGGKVVYARGFGYADVHERTPATPQTLFRIASISKPITAVAVLQLVEQGKLSLDDKIYNIVKMEPHLAPGAEADARQNEITIRQLLQHRGGWDRDASFDAMFQSVRFAEMLGAPSPAGPKEVIRCMMGLPLDFPPGEKYAYSNYGYCLLGRVIETVTGQGYEEYVRQHVLSPVGAGGMVLGKTRLEGRRENEARYYDSGMSGSVFADDLGRPIAHPYGAWNLEAMDAHGGWLASAVDLVRFASAFDDPEKCPVLKPETVRMMFADRGAIDNSKSDSKSHYALGWMVSEVGDGKLEAQHTGSLPGTSTLLIRRADGLSVAVLFNTRQGARTGRLGGSLSSRLMPLIDGIETWPEVDHFPKQ